MDEAQEILLNSLRTFGISLPSTTSSLKNLTLDSLFAICAQFLILIDGGDGGDSSPQFPSSLPSAMADRFKVCDEMAETIKGKGYRGNLSFHQFMYPSDEESFNLVRFMVEKLSESSERGKDTDDSANKPHLVCDEVEGDISEGSVQDEVVEGHTEESSNPKVYMHSEGKILDESELKLGSLREQLSKLRYVVDTLRNQEKTLMEAKHSKALEVHKLEIESEIVKVALDMAFRDQFSAELSIKELNEQVDSRKNRIMELESQWNSLKQTLEESKGATELSSHNADCGAQCVDPLKEIEQEIEETLFEIQRRELEHSRLFEEFQKLPKIPLRKSYIERITEITKNSWKQDADIDRILKETRELQLESNSIRERLDRTYVVVDEAVFREAKKDAMGRQVYRLLTSIHDNFEQISTKILATDRARREAAEQEAKLAALSSHNLDIDKLQSDLDSIRKENELLEQKLRNCNAKI